MINLKQKRNDKCRINMSKIEKTSDNHQQGNSSLGGVMRSFSMQTVLDFGKNKGKTIQQLFDEGEESYIMWIFENIDGEWSSEIERELEWRKAESEDLKREFTWG